MGTDYTVLVVYGIQETPEMLDKRRTVHTFRRTVCPDHPQDHEIRNAAAYCNQCGARVKMGDRNYDGFVEHQQAYAAAGTDPANNLDDVDFMDNNWLWQTQANSPADTGALFLGVRLAGGGDPRLDIGAELIAPTKGQLLGLQAYLAHLGLGHMPCQTYLLSCAS